MKEGPKIKYSKILTEWPQLDVWNWSENKKLWILFLYRVRKCPTEAEKIEQAEMSELLTSKDKMRPNTTEFPFLYQNV